MIKLVKFVNVILRGDDEVMVIDFFLLFLELRSIVEYGKLFDLDVIRVVFVWVK